VSSQPLDELSHRFTAARVAIEVDPMAGIADFHTAHGGWPGRQKRPGSKMTADHHRFAIERFPP